MGGNFSQTSISRTYVTWDDSNVKCRSQHNNYIKCTSIYMDHLKYCIVRYSQKILGNWCKKFYDFSRLSFGIYTQKYVSRNFLLLIFDDRMTTSIEPLYWLTWSIVNEPLDFFTMRFDCIIIVINIASSSSYPSVIVILSGVRCRG